MKSILLLSLLFLSTKTFAQVITPIYQQKIAQFKTTDLKHVVINLESNKNKNFKIDHQSFLIGNDLKNAPEYENKVSYGIKSVAGGIFSLNAINAKSYGQITDNNYLGLSYNLSNKTSSFNFSYKSLDNNKIENNVMTMTLQARF